jgi:hypothetical protein
MKRILALIGAWMVLSAVIKTTGLFVRGIENAEAEQFTTAIATFVLGTFLLWLALPSFRGVKSAGLEIPSVVRCPQDGSRISVHYGTQGPPHPWFFFWCSDCELGYALVYDEIHDWELALTATRCDGKWECQEYPTQSRRAINLQMLEQMPDLDG